VPAGLAHLVLVDNPEHHPKGDFGLDSSGQVRDNQLRENGAPTLTFSGIGVYRPALFRDLPDGEARLAPLLRAAMADHAVTGEHFTGSWWDIGTPQRLSQLDAYLRDRASH
jgi:N-acetyl-alpha-D-muramate 1-phosphate uridylyltransferase